ncbi:MAG: DNA polymerase Y family protein, partial [Rhodospirillaceae bacterium]|nr:DNA polymerase Y family protein [Rhodospirillaceae bacterium]
IASREAIAGTLRRLLSELEDLLTAAGEGARRLELSLYRGDGKVERIAVGTSAPARAPAHLMRLFADPLDAVDAGFGFDSVTLAASLTQPLAAAQLALDPQPVSPVTAAPQSLFEQNDDGEVARLIDRLGGRLGLANVRRLALFASHVPERAVVSDIALAGMAAPQPSHWPAGRQRPLSLLPRPEAVEAVAMVPDDPPVMFRWRRMLHRVVKADGPERIAAEWWHAEGTAPLGGEADSIRDYYRVEDERGRRYWLYRDALHRPGMAPGWWLHGLFG